MKLLIVDDEHLTRDGIRESLQWNAIGIRSVALAEDGVQGLQLARRFRPDIVLSDVRMPRMNGIEMAEKIREFLPECTIVFMSGYSDKEYLKSAIRLKAVSYVEKPIDLEEVHAALVDAVRRTGEQRESEQGKQLQAARKESQLALRLVQPQIPEDIGTQLSRLGLEVKRHTTFTVVAIDLRESADEIVERCVKNLLPHLERYSEINGCRILHGAKSDGIVLCHLVFPDKPPYGAVKRFCRETLALLRELGPVFVAAGRTVGSLGRVRDSYNDAASLLQSSFYLDDNAVIDPRAVAGNYRVDTALYDAFRASLQPGDEERSLALLDELQGNFRENNSTLASYAKDVYSKLLYILGDVAGERYIHLWEGAQDGGTIVDAVGECRTLTGLHKLLREKVAMYYRGIANKDTEDSMVQLIQGYILSHVGDSALSIRTISDYTGLSTSYVCTLYKNETGETLNQFITGVRLEKAKQLLRDPRLRMSEIAPAVGYPDSNYFAKLFKKKIGTTPSEYRENSQKC